MSELSHRQARRLIQMKQLAAPEQSDLAVHVAGCEACRRQAEIHSMLLRDLRLEAVRTRPSPEMTARIVRQANAQQSRGRIMNPIKTIAAFAALVLVVIAGWLVIGRAGVQEPISSPADESLPAAAAATPTRTPLPTLAPLPTRAAVTAVPVQRQIVTAEAFAGIWGYCATPNDCYYYQYLSDGTYRGAAIPDRERLENSPSVIGEFWFEDGRLYLNATEDTLTEVWTCIGHVGVYEVQLLVNGQLRFDLVEDQCDIRAEDLSGFSHEPIVLNE